MTSKTDIKAGNPASLEQNINAWLPQTQCTRCGYPDCLAYAYAIAARETGIDRCPPGGDTSRRQLARLLGIPTPDRLADEIDAFAGFKLAVIDEDECIGCTKCIDACPVDAIVGSGKMMHDVIEESCTGCELCIPPCPVDCILLIEPEARQPADLKFPAFTEGAPDRFRIARQRHVNRISQRHPLKSSKIKSAKSSETDQQDNSATSMRLEIQQAVKRARQRRQTQSIMKK